MTETGGLEDTPGVTEEVDTSQIQTVSGNLMMQEASGAVKTSSQYLVLFFLIPILPLCQLNLLS